MGALPCSRRQIHKVTMLGVLVAGVVEMQMPSNAISGRIDRDGGAVNALWYTASAENLSGKTVLHSWESESLDYRKKNNPDKAWHDYVLPIGNGHMGAGVFGGIAMERIQLNEKTLWSGGPGTEGYGPINHKGSHKYLPEIRKALLSGDVKTAQKLSEQHLRGAGPENNLENRALFGAYQTLGELDIETGISEGSVSAYRRSLDISKGQVNVSFKVGAVSYQRTMFCSYPDKIICVKFMADHAGQQNLKITLATPHPLETKAEDGVLVISGNHAENGLAIETRVCPVVDGGRAKVSADGIVVENADSVMLIITAGTDYAPDFPSYRGKHPSKRLKRTIASAKKQSFDKLQARHLLDHTALFDRVALDLGDSTDEQRALPTDQRINAYSEKVDHELESLYFQFGRYLLIASSRAGSLPANLQGVWCNEVVPPWHSDYHLNINLQMNYWPTESCNLSECHLPLIDYVDSLRKPGAVTAKEYFNADGWSAHLHSNPWGFTSPSPGNGPMFWKYFPLGGAWTAQHAWEHYAFTLDKKFLEKQGYPILKSVALFLEGYLFKLPDGNLACCPSWSPEHGPISISTTTEIAMSWDALNNAIEAAKALDVDADKQKLWTKMRDNLVPLQIGKHGQLQEWYEDIDKAKDGHRHLNHLYCLHPGRQVSPLTTPKLAQAALTTLISRGDGATGWSMGWKINFWARIHDGDHAYSLFRNLLGERTLPNMWDTHAPFQIDGNFGGTAGVAEMLLQSHVTSSENSFLIHLLPSLPKAWSKGSVKGFKARGNVTVDIAWHDGKLTEASLTSLKTQTVCVRYQETEKTISLKSGKPKTIRF